MPDAVVVGAGHNGLVAANILADAGWSVVVLEEQDHPGGAVASADYLGPGYVADVCSAFYPLAAASPAIASLELERHGLEWCHAPAVLAHPLADGRCVLLTRDVEETAAGLEELGAGDGQAWRRLCGLWRDIGEPLVHAALGPFPPLVAGARLAARLRVAGGLRFGRFAVLPVRRLAEEEFDGPGSLLLAGCAQHTDLSPEAAASSAYGWLLAMLGHQVGFPVVSGGAGQLTAALVRRLESRGGRVVCSSPVRSIVVREGRAVGVTTDGGEVPARKAVLADIVAPQLYGGLVGWDHLPAALKDDVRRFQWDYATVKVDFAVRGGVPWIAEGARRAGTIHLGESLDLMTEYSSQIAMGRVPSSPFVLMGQMTTADPSRSPAGTEVVWAYTHVPRQVRGDAGADGITGSWDDREREAITERVVGRIEQFAPGFAERVTARHVLTPADLEAHDSNLVGGAISGGTSAIHQQLVFRPTPSGAGRPETPVGGLFLASASAHPGGGVHGACGANAARAALAEERLARRVFAAPARRAFHGLVIPARHGAR